VIFAEGPTLYVTSRAPDSLGEGILCTRSNGKFLETRGQITGASVFSGASGSFFFSAIYWGSSCNRFQRKVGVFKHMPQGTVK